MMVFTVDSSPPNKNNSKNLKKSVNSQNIEEAVVNGRNSDFDLPSNENCKNIQKETSTTRNGLFNKFSTRCLIILSISSIILIVICSLLTIILTTSFMTRISSNLNNNNKNSPQVSSTPEKSSSQTETNDNVSLNDLFNKEILSSITQNSTNKLERNAFNWIKEAFRKTFFGFGNENKFNEDSRSNSRPGNFIYFFN